MSLVTSGLGSFGGFTLGGMGSYGDWDTIVVPEEVVDYSLVSWPYSGNSVRNVPVSSVLQLAGISRNAREARGVLKSGFVFVDGILSTEKTRLYFGSPFQLEVRYPNGVSRSRRLMLAQAVPKVKRRGLGDVVL